MVAAPAYDRVKTPLPGQSYNGLGQSEVAARVGLYHTDTAVISFQAGLRSPGASFNSLGPLEVRRAGSIAGNVRYKLPVTELSVVHNLKGDISATGSPTTFQNRQSSDLSFSGAICRAIALPCLTSC